MGQRATGARPAEWRTARNKFVHGEKSLRHLHLLDCLFKKPRKCLLKVIDSGTKVWPRTQVRTPAFFFPERTASPCIASIFVDGRIRQTGADADGQTLAVSPGFN